MCFLCQTGERIAMEGIAMHVNTSSPQTNPTRQERDAMGTVEVNARRLWGAQTQRSLEHFAISTEQMPQALIHALASVKQACARVNAKLGLLPEHKAQAIADAAQEVLNGQHTTEFPV